MNDMDADQVFSRLEPVLKAVPADAIEVTAHASRVGATRFADSRVHQNMTRDDSAVRVRVVLGTRSATATTNQLDRDSLRTAAARAAEAARMAPDDPDFPGLAEPPEAAPSLDRADPELLDAGPDVRAGMVRLVVDECGTRVLASGVAETLAESMAVVSSTGLRVWQRTTRAALQVVGTRDGTDVTGWGEGVWTRMRDVRPHVAAASAARNASLDFETVGLEPGSHPVLLGPDAVATLVEFLAFMGFSARAYLEGESFLAGRLGEAVCSPEITLTDDATSAVPAGPRQGKKTGSPAAINGAPPPGFTCDAEGVAKKKVTLIERGVARELVHDRRTGKEMGTRSTGHHLGPGAWPLPLNLRMEPGKTSWDEIVASTERAILVTRFHYTNVVDPRRALITGMTRDGTFLVRDGRIIARIRNMRFTDSVLEALGSVNAVGAETSLHGEDAPVLVPGLSLRGLTFTSSTRF